jgi:6-phosphogluconolactonase
VTPAFGALCVFDDPETLAHGAAEFLCQQAEAKAGVFTLCLSGGATPRKLYTVLADSPLRERFPWSRTQFFFGDERFVPPNDPASNARMAAEAMFSRAPAPSKNIYRVSTVGVSPQEAASEYERQLRTLHGAALTPERPLFDLCLLGLGEDGHTASLLPGEPVLEDRNHWVAVVSHGRPETRITLTYPALESSRVVLFLVQGESKRAILDRILSGDKNTPASGLRPSGEVLWFVDRAAAGRWA